ncbi:L-asparaginase [Halopolyspora algeriensis]|uniref:asparaginase n=1 Tax=Halopolyspora algeriensis TaxID=1500506 RepID=A0A368VVS9_9ACTN|nr:asparaginase domain-containing protein [Halopolyspora algeriensis]RCW45949.1 L-asparaginase [Halopolyspora algeriensis]TQM55362.1 L-asparaginase [Halopolyspora algeriensis]
MGRIRLLATGGTIASRSGAAGRVAAATGAELLARVRVPDRVEVEPVDAVTTGSFALQSTDLEALLRNLAAALEEGIDGVVVTHGTDTMEEVAFLAGLLHADPRPVVFTGAQRPDDDPAPDGPANLADALRLAADPHARDRGVLVGFDGYAYPARGVAKADTLGAHAFTAPGRGPALRVAEDRVRSLTPPSPPPTLPVRPGELVLPRVDVVPLYVGADAALLHAAVAAGARGLVLAAFGAGNATPAVVDAVRDVVARGMPVLVCSRVPAGPVAPLYGHGGGADLQAAGALFGGDLSPWQGRMLLATALACAAEEPAVLVHRWLEAGGDGES